jgi:chromosome segregation ATPase
MDVKEALEWADGYCSKDKERKAEVGTLAAEVRRLQELVKYREWERDSLKEDGEEFALEYKQRAEAAEARCTKYTTEIAGLHEKLEAAEAQLAKAMKVLQENGIVYGE